VIACNRILVRRLLSKGNKKNVKNWPTKATDQTIAMEILKRHSERFGYVKMLERVGQISDEGGGTFEASSHPGYMSS